MPPSANTAAVCQLAVVAAALTAPRISTFISFASHSPSFVPCSPCQSGSLSRYEGAPRPRQQRRRGSKYDRGCDFTPDLRVSRIVSAPASIRVSAGRSGRRRPPRDPIYGRRKPNCLTLLDFFSFRRRLEYRHIGDAGSRD